MDGEVLFLHLMVPKLKLFLQQRNLERAINPTCVPNKMTNIVQVMTTNQAIQINTERKLVELNIVEVDSKENLQ